MDFLSTQRIAINDYDAFRQRLTLVSALVMAVVSLIANVAHLLFGQAVQGSIPANTLLLTIPCAIAAGAAAKKKLHLAALFLFGGGSLAIFGVMFSSESDHLGNSLAGLTLLIMLSGFIGGPRFALILGLVDASLALSVQLFAFARGGAFDGGVLGAELGVILLFTLTVYLVSQNMLDLRQSLTLRLASIERVAPKLAATGIRLASDAREIYVMADQQREGASQQANSVTETREAMASILRASREIAESAQQVFQYAEQTTKNNELVVAQVDALAAQALRVGEMARGINEIAGKSELLALNAALEGVKAGPAGDGFQLVAGRMQELSESIGSLAQIIKSQAANIRSANEETRHSAQEAVALARRTTEAGRSISVVSLAQETSTEMVVSTLEDISVVINQLALGTEQTMDSTFSLLELADELPKLIHELGVQIEPDEPAPRS
jgi:hypothetical protein